MLRSKWFFVIMIFLAAVAGFFFFGRSSVNKWEIVNSTPRVSGPIVAFGDSLTAGYGAEGRGNDYPAVLSSLLSRPVMNLGVNGDTVASASTRIDELEALSPSVVILLLGGNDLLRRSNLDESFALLEAMIRRIQKGGALTVLVGLEGLPFLAPAGNRYAETAEKTGSLLVPDILKGILGDSALMADGIHPNAQGYAVMAERIADILRSYLP